MKSLFRIVAIIIALSGASVLIPHHASAQQAQVSFGVFYDELSPYGQWVDYPNYGYVWIPNADEDFVPYSTGGHWILTDDGWTWASDYSWGWAPFHYGRWNRDDDYGWFWVPDAEWGPAWVTWRRSEGYYGWAPMRSGVSLTVSFGREYNVPNDHWVFVRDRDVMREDVHQYYVPRSNNVTIINSSTVIQNTYVDNSTHVSVVAGPSREDVQKVTGSVIKPVVIQANDKPGQVVSNGQLRIYRPQVQRTEGTARPVPPKVVTLTEVKPVAERNHGGQQGDKSSHPSPIVNPATPNTSKPNQPPTGVKEPPQRVPVETPVVGQQKDPMPPDNGRLQSPPDKGNQGAREQRRPPVKMIPENSSATPQPVRQADPVPPNKGRLQTPPDKGTPDMKEQRRPPVKMSSENAAAAPKLGQQKDQMPPGKGKKPAPPPQKVKRQDGKPLDPSHEDPPLKKPF